MKLLEHWILGSRASSPILRQTIPGLCSVLLLGAATNISAPRSAAQAGADHSQLWTSGDIIFVQPGGTTGISRATDPRQGTAGQPYADLTAAVNDVLWNTAYVPTFPVVFNVQDGGTGGVSYPVSRLHIPAHGVKLQTLSNQVIELNGGMTSATVLQVDTEGPRAFSSGLPMPASIIQGFKITAGGTGIELNVLTVTSAKPIRTEIRDCVITENKYLQIFPNPVPPGGNAGGGTGIFIRTHVGAPTQYVIENNEISHQGDFFFGDNGPSSRGIHIQVPGNCVDSTLIRSNRLFDQETGIQIQGVQAAWARPRILSNFLWDQEQHVFCQQGGPALFNNTIFRARDFCMGPDRHVIHHQATPVAPGANPLKERSAMIVRNCIIEHSVAPITPGGPPAFPPTWPVDTFCGGGSVFLSHSDIEPIIGVFPQNFPTTPGAVPCALSTPVLVKGNAFGRSTAFVNSVTPDLHLLSTAVQAESGEAKDIVIDNAMILVDQEFLPCDVRTDVDGDVRLVDLNRDGVLVPDRGGDEVTQPPLFGMTLTSNADRTGNLTAGATATFVIKGMPNDLAVLQGWLDCSTTANDEVVYNNAVFSPVGNALLPLCGVINSPVLNLGPNGSATFSVPLSGLPESQLYFQAFGLTPTGTPALGTASNRVRIELN